MKLLEYIDPFFNRQPEIEFVEELKLPIHTQVPEKWGKRAPYSSEIDLTAGVCIRKEFTDKEGLLETAYNDFERFLKLHGLCGGTYPIIIKYEKTDCFEAYKITANDNACLLSAADTEGIRRALVYLEDEMLRRGGPYLSKKPIVRRPFIKTRLTRCFFSPTNRPPKNDEELANDIDYYPDEYLNRLAHEGVNGIWIYVKFRDILPSTIVREYGKDYRVRIDKLNRIVEKCRRYGIKVYILCVEPASTYHNPELLQNHKELLGTNFWKDVYGVCLSSDAGVAYAEEAMRTLFTLASGLGGLIAITVGESLSHCASNETSEINCPRCAKKDADTVLAEAETILARAIHSVKPDAEFISWRYSQRGWGKERVIKSASNVGDKTILMHNFEDLGEVMQLGRERIAVDYFLSYAGPSQMFAESVKAAKKADKRVFAKLQVCCSHEVASVPYVPVPGILYKKYKAMQELGVDGAMQSWYFGNYPSVMNKAAGELSFEPFFEDENAFLHHLAGIYWGEDADKVVQAWKYFEEGYKNFPVNVGFTWYGPMHDSVVWPLQLIPKNLPLASTWLTYEAVGGDRIGECLLNGHTLDEAIELCCIMSSNWKKGVELLKHIPRGKNNVRREQVSVATALGYQFESGLNVLNFYMKREQIGLGIGKAENILAEMKNLVEREMEISHKLKALCEKDKRLGYHSEAEGYKYFPKKLDWRIEKLRDLLATEFSYVSQRIRDGLAPLEFYLAKSQKDKKYNLCEEIIDKARWESFMFSDQSIDTDTKWRAAIDNRKIYIQINCKNIQPEEIFQIRSEFKLMWPYPAINIKQDGSKEICYPLSYSLYRESLTKEEDKWQVEVTRREAEMTLTITLKLIDFGLEINHPFKLNIERKSARPSKWIYDEYFCSRLIFTQQNHNELGWLV